MGFSRTLRNKIDIFLCISLLILMMLSKLNENFYAIWKYFQNPLRKNLILFLPKTSLLRKN